MLKTVLVTGNFNILHPGHLRLLKFAKECGDVLVVGVQSDRLSSGNSIVPQDLRLEGIKSNSLVDQAFIYDTSISELIRKLRPDIVVKGKEYESGRNEELIELQKYGGKLIFSSGESIFSSVDLLKNELSKNINKNFFMPKDFMARHGISQTDLLSLIENFSRVKICVVGDLIIDEYITCDPLGMSQEDPTIVVTPVDSTRFMGGAGIVAAHAAGLGAQASFISVVGKDDIGEFAKSKLTEYAVKAEIIVDETRPTTLKKRFRSKGKTLLRVSHLHQEPVSAEIQNLVFEAIKKHLIPRSILVFSDFNYGVLPQILVEKIILHAKNNNVMIVADSQSSSQVGDIGRFKGMDLITPTEREARIAERNYTDGLVVLAEKIRGRNRAKNVFLKLGEEGVLINTDVKIGDNIWHTDRIEALNLSPRDSAGAGDSMLVVSTLALACGGSIWSAACLGSIAAAIQVGRVGNTPLNASELINEIQL